MYVTCQADQEICTCFQASSLVCSLSTQRPKNEAMVLIGYSQRTNFSNVTNTFCNHHFNLITIKKLGWALVLSIPRTSQGMVGLGTVHFYHCVPSDLAFEWKRGWSWPCFATNLMFFICKCKLVSLRTWSTCEKQEGLFQNKVTSSITSTQRPGH